MGQLSHEPHGVGHQDRLAAGQLQTSGGGVERREETVLDQHTGVGEAIEQRGLARVGVPDDHHVAEQRTASGLALGVAHVGDAAQLLLELVDAPDQSTTVDLELGLARPASADAGTLLRHRAASSTQAREADTRSRANSTCALPSRLDAFWAKMSRITAVRSIAVRPSTFSRLNC
jgi:hypothetical protein